MKKLFTIISVALLSVNPLSAKVVTGYESHPADNGLELRVDSIDYRKELTRVYGTLIGRPHTSNRIDNVKFDGIQCTDIDGVDFNRYFQWEEEGEIPVELDFPHMKYDKSGVIELQTPRDNSKIIFSRSAH